MRLIIRAGLALALAAATPAFADQTHIWENGSRPSTKVGEPNFAGDVRLDPLFPTTALGNANGSLVTFEPGAHSVWHTHPAGQLLIITAGKGWVQEWGGPKREVQPGDVIWTPPGVKHWHGASATTSMTHIAITVFADGKNVDWGEKVTPDQYGK